MVVGLAPAAHGANRTGRIFTGDRSGDWLFASLHRVGLAPQRRASADDGLRLHGRTVTLPVRCAPPANKPTPAERDACAPGWTRVGCWPRRSQRGRARRLRLAGCGRRCARGGAAARAAAAFGHGARWLDVRRPAVVLGAGRFHVSQQNTFTGRLTAQMLDEVLLSVR